MPLFSCRTESDTAAIGSWLGSRAWPGLILSAEGPLGAGKTVFARGLAAGLGVEGPVTSPSYPIIQEYDGRVGFCHMDWYRLGSEDEVEETGAAELLGSAAVCLVEWPDRAPGLLGPGALAVRIAIVADGTRKLTIDGPAESLNRLGWPNNLPPDIAALKEHP